MGCLRLVGSLNLQVSFAEYSLFYRALLQKRPVILKPEPTDRSHPIVDRKLTFKSDGLTFDNYGVATISRLS